MRPQSKTALMLSLGIALSINATSARTEASDPPQDPPLLAQEGLLDPHKGRSGEIKRQRERVTAQLERMRPTMSPLEQIATREPTVVPPKEAVLEHRFEDVSGLFGLLNDPQLNEYWTRIVHTIAIAGNKDAAIKLMEYIKNGPDLAATDSELVNNAAQHKALEARLNAVESLAYSLNGQSIEEVTVFLTEMGRPGYAEQLGFNHNGWPHMARSKSYNVLAIVGTDASLAILDDLKSERKAAASEKEIKALSAGQSPQDVQGYSRAVRDVQIIESYVDLAQRKRAGVIHP